ncbi:MAG: nucleotidyltransferase, partial [Bacillota bacterium]
MESAISQSRPGDEPGADTAVFYRHVLETLNASTVPFLVGGAYALHRYTGVNRHTRDLDIFIRRSDLAAVSAALRQAGYDTELTFPHWLAKVRANGVYIDLIFSSGNAIAEVDDAWFEHASDDEVLGLPTRICPAEEMIWSKAFIMERERFDGADILHLLRARADQLDWQRLFRRFEPHWRILLVHLTLFGFVYPAQRALVPAAIMDELIERLRRETHSAPPQHAICLG